MNVPYYLKESSSMLCHIGTDNTSDPGTLPRYVWSGPEAAAGVPEIPGGADSLYFRQLPCPKGEHRYLWDEYYLDSTLWAVG